MKNRYLVLLAGLLVAGSMLLVACGGDKDNKPADTKAPTAAQTDPATDPAEDTSAPAENDTTAPAENDTTAPAENDTTAPDEDDTTAPDETPFYDYWEYLRDYVPHVALDAIKENSVAGVDLRPADYDGFSVVSVSDTLHTLHFWGWAAVTETPYEFGYVIDDGEIITNPDFTVEAEQPVIDAIASVGGVAGNRFWISVDVAALEGVHNIKALVKLDDTYVIIAEFNIDKEGVTETTPVEDETTPDNVEVVDISTLAGQETYKSNFIAAGYNKPLFLLDYDQFIDLGEMDLSKYTTLRIEYGCDGSDVTKERFEPLNGDAPIGLKSTATSYGNSGSYQMDGDIAHGDMVFSTNGWASGARWVEIDLTNVDYVGNVYLSIHSPESTGIAISGIQFVLAETQPEA